jgi:adenine C2-methylase RlmN of 23S rRNA A2503 and tRNA A37
MNTDISKLKEKLERAKKQIVKTNQEIKKAFVESVYKETYNLYLSDFKNIDDFTKKIKDIFKDVPIDNKKSKSKR